MSTNRIESSKFKLLQPVLVLGKGKIKCGSRCVFGYYPSPYFFNGYIHIEARGADAQILIGDNCHFNNNLVIIAEHGNIVIGNDLLCGTNVEIFNSDFHSISISKRHERAHHSKDVYIGNNVFIGSNVKILKGVTIGDNAVLGNGAVVTCDVEPNSVVNGNPAKFYKLLNE